MRSQPEIVSGHLQDLPLIQQVHDDFYVHNGPYSPVFSKYVAQGLQEFRDNFNPDREHIWLAKSGGSTVGFVAMRDAGDGWSQLRYLYVDESTRGTGLGRRLVQTVLDFARDVGYDCMLLWTVENQTAAGALYRKLGFKLVEEKPSPWHPTFLQQRYDLRLRD